MKARVAAAFAVKRRADGALDRPEDVVLLKIDGEWHGIWQTADANGPRSPREPTRPE